MLKPSDAPAASRRRPAVRAFGAFCALALAFSAAACSTTDVDKPLTHKSPPLARAANFLHEQPVIVLNAAANPFVWKEYDKGEKLPDMQVGPIKAAGTGVLTLMELLLEPAGVALSPGPGIEDRPVTLIDPRRIPLAQAVDMIAQQAGVFYNYKGGVLSLSTSRNFVVHVPRIANSQDVLLNAFNNLGAHDIYPDRVAGTLSFSADWQAYTKIRQYMRGFESGRDQLVYDLWIMEIDNEKSHQIGVAQSDPSNPNIPGFTGYIGHSGSNYQIQTTTSASSTISSTVNSTLGNGFSTIGLIATPAGAGVEAFLNFAESEGDTKTLANPKIALMSGGTASFVVGQTQSYIRNITTNNNAVTTGTTCPTTGTTGTTGTGTTGTAGAASSAAAAAANCNTGNIGGVSGTDVEDLKTGIMVNIGGSYSDGIIHTELDLRLEDLIKFNTFSTGAGANAASLQLPYTSDRVLKTSMDARPGDVIIVGGLLKEQGDNVTTGLTGGIPISNTGSHTQDELVILLRPRLIEIRPPQLLQTNVPIGAPVTEATPAPQRDKGDWDALSSEKDSPKAKSGDATPAAAKDAGAPAPADAPLGGALSPPAAPTASQGVFVPMSPGSLTSQPEVTLAPPSAPAADVPQAAEVTLTPPTLFPSNPKLSPASAKPSVQAPGPKAAASAAPKPSDSSLDEFSEIPASTPPAGAPPSAAGGP